MNLNHIHLQAKDVAATSRFYQVNFGFRKKMDHGEGVFLVSDDNFLIAIDPMPEPFRFPDWFHIGFCMDDPEKVRSLYARMKESGADFARDLTEYDGEATVFHAIDPDGCRIEVSWHRE